MAKKTEYPPVSFYFQVHFEGIPGLAPNDGDAYFQEVSGLSREFQLEQSTAGGTNDNNFTFPTTVRYPNLVLKRGLFKSSGVLKWVDRIMDDPNRQITPCTALVSLLNPNGEPLMSFNFENVFPLKWSLDGFNAQESKIAVETMEFYYKKFKIIF